MTEKGSPDGFDRGGTTGADPDRAWWLEPDPVEVAALRAERDGLRLEVEGLRAKLAIAQEQLTFQSGIGEAVRDLRTIVGRLSISRPDLAAAPPVTDAVAVGPVVFPTAPVIPDVEGPIVDLTVDPRPSPGAPAVDESDEPGARSQLAAMELWPPRRRSDAADTASAFAPPAPEPCPPATSPGPPSEPVSSWDLVSARMAPVAADPAVGRLGPDPVPSERRRARRVLTKVGAGLGILAVVLVMAVTVGPRFLPYRTYFVRSGSMEPTIHVGAMVVLTETDASTLEVGDIISFENPDEPGIVVTHRIVGVDHGESGRTLVTKGDANRTSDAWRVPARGDGWRYAFDVPLIGYVFGYLGTAQARLALLAVPAVILGLLRLLDIWSPTHTRTEKRRH